jgi:hypothetical protein
MFLHGLGSPVSLLVISLSGAFRSAGTKATMEAAAFSIANGGGLA